MAVKASNVKDLTNNGTLEMKKLTKAKKKTGHMLLISFLLMIVIGLGNKIFLKLQTLPMHNYPFFLNLMSTFIYIPISFIYIIPMQKYGSAITKECQEISQWKFVVMGILDGIGGTMAVFAVNFITNSSMIILLTQASIPISMGLSKGLLSAQYTRFQYLGAIIVVMGIIVVLIPSIAGGSGGGGGAQFFWAIVLVVSCVPQVLSSVYKEKALGETDVDVIYLNGWVSIYQFLINLPLAIPSAYASNISVSDLPLNTINGAKCYVGINSVLTTTTSFPKDDCAYSFEFVTIYLLFNVFYNILLIMILKYGSANILWLAMTVMVPLGNVAFSLDFVPSHMPLKDTDVIGLVVIMLGLISYRFADTLILGEKKTVSIIDDEEENAAAHHALRYLGVNSVEVMLEPLIDTYKRSHRDILKKSPLEIRTSYLSRLGFTPTSTPPGSKNISQRLNKKLSGGNYRTFEEP